MEESCLGCFCSNDVDFYCWNIDFEKMDRLLATFGFALSERRNRRKAFAREYKSSNAISEEFWLNFQWKPVTRRKIRLCDQRKIMARYQTFFQMTENYGDTSIKLFKPECNVYLNCIHISSGHYYILSPGLRLYVDIDRPIRARKIDWAQIRKWVEEDEIGMRSDLVLKISERVLDTPIPANAYTSLVMSARFTRMMNSIINWKTMELKQPRGKLQYKLFCIRVELLSDGRNWLFALLNRLCKAFIEKD